MPIVHAFLRNVMSNLQSSDSSVKMFMCGIRYLSRHSLPEILTPPASSDYKSKIRANISVVLLKQPQEIGQIYI